MNFFERIFGWSPDGGSSLETLIFLIPVILLVGFWGWRRFRREP